MGWPGTGCTPDPSRGVLLSSTTARGCYIPAGTAEDGGTLGPHKPCGSLRSGPSCPPPPCPHILIYGVRALVTEVTLSGSSSIYGVWLNSQQIWDPSEHACQLYEGLGTQDAAGLFPFHSKSTCCEGPLSYLNCSFHPSHPQVGLLIHSLKIL